MIRRVVMRTSVSDTDLDRRKTGQGLGEAFNRMDIEGSLIFIYKEDAINHHSG